MNRHRLTISLAILIASACAAQGSPTGMLLAAPPEKSYVALIPAEEPYLVASAISGQKTWRLLFTARLPATIAIGVAQTPNKVVRCVLTNDDPNLACATELTDDDVLALFRQKDVTKKDPDAGIRVTTNRLPRPLSSSPNWLPLLQAIGVNVQASVASARCSLTSAQEDLGCVATWWSCGPSAASELCAKTELSRVVSHSLANGDRQLDVTQVSVDGVPLSGTYEWPLDVGEVLNAGSAPLAVPVVSPATYCLPSALLDTASASCFSVGAQNSLVPRPFDTEYDVRSGVDTLTSKLANSLTGPFLIDASPLRIARRRVVVLASFGAQKFAVPVGVWTDRLGERPWTGG